MPRLATSSSLSPGMADQWRPDMVLEREMTSEMGREFELPKTWDLRQLGNLAGHQWLQLTAIAVTKFLGRFSNRKIFDMAHEHTQDIVTWATKMKGIMARSDSILALSWEASLVKTVPRLAFVLLSPRN